MHAPMLLTLADPRIFASGGARDGLIPRLLRLPSHPCGSERRCHRTRRTPSTPRQWQPRPGCRRCRPALAAAPAVLAAAGPFRMVATAVGYRAAPAIRRCSPPGAGPRAPRGRHTRRAAPRRNRAASADEGKRGAQGVRRQGAPSAGGGSSAGFPLYGHTGPATGRVWEANVDVESVSACVLPLQPAGPAASTACTHSCILPSPARPR